MEQNREIKINQLPSKTWHWLHMNEAVVTVPEKLNEEQKEALRRFDDAMNGIAPEGPKKKRGLFKGLEK